MYPSSERAENQIPYDAQLKLVQEAVDSFQTDSSGLLPIKTRDQDVDQYIKYPIDFEKLVPRYLPELPGNAFETGGIYQYVLMDVEENPTVKLVDLRMAEKLRELNIKLGVNGYGPIKDEIAPNVYTLDFSVMGYKEEQTVKSPYSDVHLPIIATGDGKLYVDYSIELNKLIQEENLTPKQGEDIRALLVEKYPILPAYSLPYTVNEKNEPIFNLNP
ncbi:hypothetical protein [Paenisporosarcina cavernae]